MQIAYLVASKTDLYFRENNAADQDFAKRK